VPVSRLFRDEVANDRHWPRWPYIAATVLLGCTLAMLAIKLAYDQRIAAIFVASAGAGFVYAIFVSTVVYRELNAAAFYLVLVRSARATAMVMFLVGCAMVASWLITVAQLPQNLALLLQPLVDSPRLLMLTIMVLVLLVGMVMDLSPTILILVPLLMPVVNAAGIDPVYFGLMFVINTSIGLITPPVGTVLNVVCGIGKVRLETAVTGVVPFIAVYMAMLLLFILVPELITVPMAWLIG
jgi:TRAP-type transport system large permease protein